MKTAIQLHKISMSKNLPKKVLSIIEPQLETRANSGNFNATIYWDDINRKCSGALYECSGLENIKSLTVSHLTSHGFKVTQYKNKLFVEWE